MSEFIKKITEIIPCDLRLDRYAAEILCILSRSQIKARNLKAKINGKEVKISHIVRNGDLIELAWDEPEPENIIPEDIPLNIIYEDDRCIVVNKEQGMVVHPGAGNRKGTLVNALYFRSMERKGGLGCNGIRPGIIHRLDKDTSGTMIAAHDDEALAFLSQQFESRKVKKEYIAIIKGIPKEKKIKIETFIARNPANRKRFSVAENGKQAVTFLTVLKTWESHSLVLLRPKTGRTHQLRVHMQFLGHPITGDPLYSGFDALFPNATLMLHSRRLAITLPGDEKERVFTSPLPQRFKEMIKFLSTNLVS